MKINKLFGLPLLVLTLCLTSCSDGEDGASGLSGISCWDINGDGINDADEDINQDGQFNALDCQGLNGQDGADGMDGTDGTDGEGFDELTQFGSITVNLSGTRPDGETFEDSAVFKFAGLDGGFFDDGGNTMLIEEGPDFTAYSFGIFRFLTAPDDSVNRSFTGFSLVFSNLGEADESLLLGSLSINEYTVIGDDYKYFVMTDSFQSGANGTSEFEFTDLSFDRENNNNLSFSYSFEVLAANNSTGNPLTVSGEVDVYLLEKIQ
ncbi:hypothetical protein [Flagellimonas sp.]|uniref:hypothetical protein n=1 Tax=Flagellimonas sp. TaxID=2058762 RepID=UPI003BAA369E